MSMLTGGVAAGVVVLVIVVSVASVVFQVAATEQPELGCGLDLPAETSDDEAATVEGAVRISDRLMLSAIQVANARLIIGIGAQVLVDTETVTAAVMRSVARAELVNAEVTNGLLALDPVGYPAVNVFDKGAAVTAFFDSPAEASDVDEEWRTEAQAIVDLWATSLANPTVCTPAGDSAEASGPVSAGEIVSVEGIRVHVSIAGDLRALLAAARGDGISLSGWGYRDHAAQIRLRRQHCGTSDYAIYEMPSSQCRPPTARPGRSMHEQGRAIDFTYNGRSIGSRSSPAFRWLAANAAGFGLFNLPSEPWHWSTNGR